MSNYFYSENNQQVGPVTMEELKTKNITRETMVWKEGMENWQKACEVNELSDLFAAVPPPLPKQKVPVPPPIPPSISTPPPPPPPRSQQVAGGDTNNNFNTNQNLADNLGTGMKVLSFIIPIVGLIIYFTNKTTFPNKSQIAGKMALYGIITWTILNIIAM